jgi:DNA-binding transcriptional ArsR family regulator
MDRDDVCEIEHVNEKAVQEVKSNMFDDQTILKIANISKILGDATRVKILFALSQKELCVCDLASLLGMSQSAISHQLRLLRNTNLVKFRREGKVVYYSLSDEHVIKLIEIGAAHAQE